MTEGDEIVLVVSKGKEQKDTTMPALIGKWESQVETIILNAGLAFGGVQYEASEDVEKGMVTRFTVDGKSVSEGSTVREGSTVVVYVSSGSKYEGQEVAETVHLGDSPFDGDSGNFEVKLSTGEVVWSKDNCSSDDFPVEFTIKGLHGTTESLGIYVNGRNIGSYDVKFNAAD